MKIQMVDLYAQYLSIKSEVDAAINEVLNSTAFIGGPAVHQFIKELAEYNDVPFVIACANGTDALQLAMMALELKPGDEVIVPTFTYVATAEVIALLGLKPVFADVDPDTFMISLPEIEKKITPNTRAIVPVHLFGQCADMEGIMKLAEKNNIFVIEDTAQAIGSEYTFSDGTTKNAGTIGTMGTTSFFPSKNLGCYGDGGAILVSNKELADKVRVIANHGQKIKYYHDTIGINSRLDTLQAAILSVKLKRLDYYCSMRNNSADFYDKELSSFDALSIPKRVPNSSHVFHQYTIKCEGFSREDLKAYLQQKGIPTMVYYPVPLHKQKAYEHYNTTKESFPVSESLSEKVLSLPIHTEQNPTELQYITDSIKSFLIEKSLI